MHNAGAIDGDTGIDGLLKTWRYQRRGIQSRPCENQPGDVPEYQLATYPQSSMNCLRQYF